MKINIKTMGLEANKSTEVQVGRFAFWVDADSEGNPARVIKSQCAHMGSRLKRTKTGYTCPTHGWIYKADGSNLTEGNPGLEVVDFLIDGEDLVLDFVENEPLLSPNGSLVGDETLRLLAHASFLLEAEEKSVLFDPWLDGPTYWGAWHHYPSHTVDISSLHPTDIIITHPHPDHFHPETLKAFDRDTRIHIPNFQSGIMQKELAKLGFNDVNLVPWETPVRLTQNLEFAFLRPVSQWEDSACLVRVSDWVWLNQNDSGAPLRDDFVPSQVDLLSTSFDVGASGFPLTWDVEPTRQTRIIESSKSKILETISQRCRDLNARNYAPFAGWWRHGLEIQQNYAERLVHTSLADLEDSLKSTETELLRTIPSAVINLKSMKCEFDQGVMNKLSEPVVVKPFKTPKTSLEHGSLGDELTRKTQRMQELSHAAGVEPVDFVISVPEINYEESFSFGEQNVPGRTKIWVEVPSWVAEKLVSEDETATWNHFDIGYWLKWTREPDTFTANFMALLQLGWPSDLMKSSGNQISRVESLAVAEFLEKNPELGSAILTRAGLPCAGCTKTTGDTLENAFKIHRVPEGSRLRALRELEAMMS